jgi:hypothetical protein
VERSGLTPISDVQQRVVAKGRIDKEADVD